MKVNCAQAVGETFSEKYPLEDDSLRSLKELGGGRAPGNLCGAYYSARMSLENHAPEHLDGLDAHFLNSAGSLQCREIRTSKSVKCAECVALASEYLNNI